MFKKSHRKQIIGAIGVVILFNLVTRADLTQAAIIRECWTIISLGRTAADAAQSAANTGETSEQRT